MTAINIFDFAPESKPATTTAPKKAVPGSVCPTLPVSAANGEGFAVYAQPTNPVTGREYKGVQSTFLRSASNQFAGFQQWLSVGRIVRKGEHGLKILMPIPTPDGERQRFMARVVFAVEQTDVAQVKGE